MNFPNESFKRDPDPESNISGGSHMNEEVNSILEQNPELIHIAYETLGLINKTPAELVDEYAPEIYVHEEYSDGTRINAQGEFEGDLSEKFQKNPVLNLSISHSHRDGTYTSEEVSSESLEKLVRENQDIVISTTGKIEDDGAYVFRDAIVPVKYVEGKWKNAIDLQVDSIVNSKPLIDTLLSDPSNFPTKTFKTPIKTERRAAISVAELEKYLRLNKVFQVILSNKFYFDQEKNITPAQKEQVAELFQTYFKKTDRKDPEGFRDFISTEE